MGKHNTRFMLTFIAGADLSGNIYYAVKKDTSGNKVVLAGAGDPVLGILQNKPTSGQAANVLIEGVTPAVTGSTDIAEGDLAASDAAGKTVTAASGNYTSGICQEAGNHTTGKLATILLGSRGKV